MTAREYLTQIWKLQDSIKEMTAKIGEREIRMRSISGIRYDKINVQSSPINSMEEAIAAQCEDTAKLDRLVILYESKLADIISQLDAMPRADYAEVLKLYFVRRIRIREIAWKSQYVHTNDAAYHAYERGLRMFAEMYGLD